MASSGSNPFNFPFVPYPSQLQLMQKMTRAVEDGKIGLFSSPTGTGKSLSIICATFSWLKEHRQKRREDIVQKLATLETKLSEVEKDSDWITAHVRKLKLTDQLRDAQGALEPFREYEDRSRQLKESRTKNVHAARSRPHEGIKKTKVDESGADDAENLEDQLVDYHSDEDGAYADGDEKEEKKSLKPVIVYCSRTHSQLSQFVEEVGKTVFCKDTRVVSLASRANLCINRKVLRLKENNSMNERCVELHKKKACPYYKHTLVGELRDEILSQIVDIEEAASLGSQLKACSYYGSRFAASEADVLVVPYNALLHAETRKSLNLDLTESVVVVDEAHNLLETLASIHSAFISGLQVFECHSKLSQYMLRYNSRLNPKNLLYIKQLIQVLGCLIRFLKPETKEKSCVCTTSEFMIKAGFDNINIFKLINYCDKSQLSRKLLSFSSTSPIVAITNSGDGLTNSGTSAFLAKLKDARSKSSGSGKAKKSEEPGSTADTKAVQRPSSSYLLQIVAFLRALTNPLSKGKVIVARDSTCFRKSVVKFLLLDPAEHFKDIVSLSRSVILIGGTMEPFSEYTDHIFRPLGLSDENVSCFSCGHVIPDQNLIALSVGSGPSGRISMEFNYSKRTSPSLIMELGLAILAISSTVTGGVIVFLPSYEYENSVYQILEKNEILQKIESQGKRVFREPRQNTGINSVLESYKRSCLLSKGALLFSVVGGKMSEGINFGDSLGRCVIVVGLPFANCNSPEVKERMAFYDSIKSGDGHKYYVNSCMKAVNQSIGRVIRHANDYAAIILLDLRYNTRTEIRVSLPLWVQKRLKAATGFGEVVDDLKLFFKSKKNPSQ